MTINHAKSISDDLGAHVMASALGVSSHSIRYARTEGTFPASWYFIISGLCSGAGIDCPMSAFNWKTPVDAPLSEAS